MYISYHRDFGPCVAFCTECLDLLLFRITITSAIPIVHTAPHRTPLIESSSLHQSRNKLHDSHSSPSPSPLTPTQPSIPRNDPPIRAPQPDKGSSVKMRCYGVFVKMPLHLMNFMCRHVYIISLQISDCALPSVQYVLKSASFEDHHHICNFLHRIPLIESSSLHQSHNKLHNPHSSPSPSPLKDFHTLRPSLIPHHRRSGCLSPTRHNLPFPATTHSSAPTAVVA